MTSYITNSRDNGDEPSDVVKISKDGCVIVRYGTPFIPGELYCFSGFSSPQNTGIFRCTNGSTTSPVFSNSGLADELAGPITRLKCVGFQFNAGDIKATPTGLRARRRHPATRSIDFTEIPALRESAGAWIKIGGNLSSEKFGTTSINTWVRIVKVRKRELILRNLPDAWRADAGLKKLIKIWYGDRFGFIELS